jgi:hypothetical protein
MPAPLEAWLPVNVQMLLLTLAFTSALATPPPFPEPEGPLPRAAFDLILVPTIVSAVAAGGGVKPKSNSSSTAPPKPVEPIMMSVIPFRTSVARLPPWAVLPVSVLCEMETLPATAPSAPPRPEPVSAGSGK